MSLRRMISLLPGGPSQLAQARTRRDVRNAIDDARTVAGMSRDQLAQSARIPASRVDGILDGTLEPTISEAAALAHAAGFTLSVTLTPDLDA